MAAIKKSYPRPTLKSQRTVSKIGNKTPVRSKGMVKSLTRRGAIYISNLPHGFFERALHGYFSQFGTIRRLKVARSSRTAKPMGFAFLEFQHEKVALISAKTMHNYLMFKKLLKCEFIKHEDISNRMFKNRDMTPELCRGTINKRRNQYLLENCSSSMYEKKKRKKVERLKNYMKDTLGMNLRDNIETQKIEPLNVQDEETLSARKLKRQLGPLLCKKMTSSRKRRMLPLSEEIGQIKKFQDVPSTKNCENMVDTPPVIRKQKPGQALSSDAKIIRLLPNDQLGESSSIKSLQFLKSGKKLPETNDNMTMVPKSSNTEKFAKALPTLQKRGKKLMVDRFSSAAPKKKSVMKDGKKNKKMSKSNSNLEKKLRGNMSRANLTELKSSLKTKAGVAKSKPNLETNAKMIKLKSSLKTKAGVAKSKPNLETNAKMIKLKSSLKTKAGVAKSKPNLETNAKMIKLKSSLKTKAGVAKTKLNLETNAKMIKLKPSLKTKAGVAKSKPNLETNAKMIKLKSSLKTKAGVAKTKLNLETNAKMIKLKPTLKTNEKMIKLVPNLMQNAKIKLKTNLETNANMIRPKPNAKISKLKPSLKTRSKMTELRLNFKGKPESSKDYTMTK